MILTNQYFHIADTGHVWLHFSFLDISIRDISKNKICLNNFSR